MNALVNYKPFSSTKFGLFFSGFGTFFAISCGAYGNLTERQTAKKKPMLDLLIIAILSQTLIELETISSKLSIKTDESIGTDSANYLVTERHVKDGDRILFVAM